MSDGLLEVVAIDNLDLAILHAGGSGASVCQCRKAIITTKRPIPMQVSLCFGFFPISKPTYLLTIEVESPKCFGLVFNQGGI